MALRLCDIAKDPDHFTAPYWLLLTRAEPDRCFNNVEGDCPHKSVCSLIATRQTTSTDTPDTEVHSVQKSAKNNLPAVTIGRADLNDIVIDDASISRCHAWIVHPSDQPFAIIDGGSKNGVRLNWTPIDKLTAVTLKPGDRVSFGALQARFVSREEMLMLAQQAQVLIKRAESSKNNGSTSA
jgi:pSer/pThr/pTyr-binding forkhead associated (FHA) protein